MIALPDNWIKHFQVHNGFERLFAVDGEVFREKDGRRTIRFTFEGGNYFGKFHQGIGWKKIIKTLFQLRLPPALSAQNEWLAIQRLEQINIKTMRLVGYGKKGYNPARIKSFVIVEELNETQSLEDFCRNWPISPPEPSLKRALIAEVANIARIFHGNAMNHRDFYICHFLLKLPQVGEKIDPENLSVHLIDLHRVQQRRHLPKRWQIKDIAGLYFSSMAIGLTTRDFFRFIKIYSNKPLKEALHKDKVFWKRVKEQGESLYRSFNK